MIVSRLLKHAQPYSRMATFVFSELGLGCIQRPLHGRAASLCRNEQMYSFQETKDGSAGLHKSQLGICV